MRGSLARLVPYAGATLGPERNVASSMYRKALGDIGYAIIDERLRGRSVEHLTSAEQALVVLYGIRLGLAWHPIVRRLFNLLDPVGPSCSWHVITRQI